MYSAVWEVFDDVVTMVTQVNLQLVLENESELDRQASKSHKAGQ